MVRMECLTSYEVWAWGSVGKAGIRRSVVISNNPGIANSVQSTKNPSHPSHVASKPVVDPAMTRGMPMILVSKAYCVAVKRLFVRLAMNATKAVVPIPPVRFSKAMTAVNVGRWFPTMANTTKPAVEII